MSRVAFAVRGQVSGPAPGSLPVYGSRPVRRPNPFRIPRSAHSTTFPLIQVLACVLHGIDVYRCIYLQLSILRSFRQVSSSYQTPTRYRSLADVLHAREQENLRLLSRKLYSTTEAAMALSTHPSTIRRWIRQGLIVGVRPGRGKFRVPEDEISRLKGER
jgi:excisionase family DNA binding protein